jgi:hypothetical protein
MTEAEVMAALAMPAEHPMWRAVLAILDERVEQAVGQVSAPELAGEPALLHTAGGIEWLRDLRETLEGARGQALAKVAELATKEHE